MLLQKVNDDDANADNKCHTVVDPFSVSVGVDPLSVSVGKTPPHSVDRKAKHTQNAGHPEESPGGLPTV